MSLISGPGRAVGSLPDHTLCVQKHVEYIKNLDSRRDELEYWLTEHLRLNGVYWGLTALHLLGFPEALPREETIDFVLSCQRENGGFGAAPGHDAHMLYTVSAVQILVTLDAVDELEKRGLGGKQKVAAFIAGLQDRTTGSFMGDEWGELDTRFVYGAFNALSLLGLLDLVDVSKAVAYIQKCENLDGGYGICPGAESHAGQVFTCVGALAIAGRLDLVNKDRLGGWLSERQLDNGGLNGRPEKLPDACYSWWVGSSLAMIDRLHWIDGHKLATYILRCQDPEAGGFGDRPGNMVDVFHTNFAIAGLSLLKFEGVQEVDPVYSDETWDIPATFPTQTSSQLQAAPSRSSNVYVATSKEAGTSLRTSITCTEGNGNLKISLGLDPSFRLPKMDAEALQCNICPKRARFSDVSHLLTHVSSKAHLSHYFKLQVRSHQEIQARNLLDEYDKWYKANNLAKLLSDRMASKEARKRKSQGNTLAPATSSTARRGAGSSDTPRAICPPSHQPLPEFLDPRLSDPYLNGNSIVRSGDASDSTHHETSAASSVPPQFLPRTGYTLHSNDPCQELAPNQCKQEPDCESEEEGLSNPQITPSRSMKLESRSANTLQPLSSTSVDDDPFLDDNGSFDYLRLVGGDKERADEMTRLKGVLWPGMDIFDSATEQMRRKRNQKKDESILKMMEKTSMCVEPTELVFSPTGILRKQRVISGNVEDSSPLKGETPIPKRRAPRPKRALSQVDPNVPRGQDRKRSKKLAKRTAIRREAGLVRYDSQASGDPGAHLPYKYGVNPPSSYGDENEEFSLAVNGLESRARSGFTVFHNEPNQHVSRYDEPYLRFGVSSPSRETSFRRGATAESRINRFPGNQAPLPSGRAAHASAEKENIDPMLNAHSRGKSPLLWQSSMIRPPHPGDTGYAPQYFFEEAQSNGLSPFESHGFYAGYAFNPLLITATKLPTENPFFDADGRNSSRLHSMTRATSPEATISDLEEDDFEHLYLDTSSL